MKPKPISLIKSEKNYDEGNNLYYHITTNLSSKKDLHPYLARCHSKRGKGKNGNKIRFSIDRENESTFIPQNIQTTNTDKNPTSTGALKKQIILLQILIKYTIFWWRIIYQCSFYERTNLCFLP